MATNDAKKGERGRFLEVFLPIVGLAGGVLAWILAQHDHCRETTLASTERDLNYIAILANIATDLETTQKISEKIETEIKESCENSKDLARYGLVNTAILCMRGHNNVVPETVVNSAVRAINSVRGAPPSRTTKDAPLNHGFDSIIYHELLSLIQLDSEIAGLLQSYPVLATKSASEAMFKSTRAAFLFHYQQIRSYIDDYVTLVTSNTPISDRPQFPQELHATVEKEIDERRKDETLGELAVSGCSFDILTKPHFWN